MVIGCLIACLAIHASPPTLWNQNPSDPLAFGPGMHVGSRLQYGLNVLPTGWTYTGTLAERSTVDTNLTGFQIIGVNRPDSGVKRDSDKFDEVPCDFLGSTPVVTVFAQDGSRHKFSVDSGATHSYVQAALAQNLNFGREEPLPMCLYLPNDKWVHFKAEVDRSIAVLASSSEDFPVEGILGTNAISCLQLKIDYRAKKVWARVSSKSLDDKVIAEQLGTRKSLVPITRQDSGRYTVDVRFGAKTIPLELDTGASLIGLMPSTIKDLNLEKVGQAQVLVQNGTKTLSKYVATDVIVGDSKLLWPIIHEGFDARLSYGGFGPSMLPHQQVILDFPGLRMFVVKPTEAETIAQAISQLISNTVMLENGEAILDAPDIVGPARAAITKLEDQPIAAVILDLRKIAKGDSTARARILALCRALNASEGHFTIRQNGVEIVIKS